MKLSYNWLLEYMDVKPTPQEMAEILTDTGLEVEGLEQAGAVKGGLAGLVIGEVLDKEKHPDADRLNITKVNIGNGEPLRIVCGAPNVEAGQKVVVAPPGTTIYPTTGDPFEIREAKIRGEVSQGMICAEDEIGLGTGHDGIMVLEADAEVGKAAADHFKLGDDWTLEIGLTPNRTDGMCHIGAAADLVASWNVHRGAATLKRPEVVATAAGSGDNIQVVVEDEQACPRYCGITIEGVTVKESPDWLLDRLKGIGLAPINNVVDVTNFVLHEMGQPLHAFDRAKITGDQVIVKKLAGGSKFITLDGEERELHQDDLMICNSEGGMCIAGVFGGAESGITESTTAVFLESAYFDPVHVRRTAKRHGLNTDASFRFERGVDPNITRLALDRATALILEVAGGSISSAASDTHPDAFAGQTVSLSYTTCDRLIGKQLGRDEIRRILGLLDITITSDTDAGLELTIPTNRVDVTREADVVEEILRIYGYNNIELPGKISFAVETTEGVNKQALRNKLAAHLVANGFNEIMNNSLTTGKYNEKLDTQLSNEDAVTIVNPLSQELDMMRQTMLYSGLECVARNQNHQNPDLRLFEFGNVYANRDGYSERFKLSMLITGSKEIETWNATKGKVDFADLGAVVDGLLDTTGVEADRSSSENGLFTSSVCYKSANAVIAEMGSVRTDILKHFDIKEEVLYAEIDMPAVEQLHGGVEIQHAGIPKFPSTRRDFSLLLDEGVQFADLQKAALACDEKILQRVGLFDVYEGDKLPAGKKSYALSFEFQDRDATLTDEVVDAVMSKIRKSFENDFGAELR